MSVFFTHITYLCLSFIKLIVLLQSRVCFSISATYLSSCSFLDLCVPCYRHVGLSLLIVKFTIFTYIQCKQLQEECACTRQRAAWSKQTLILCFSSRKTTLCDCVLMSLLLNNSGTIPRYLLWRAQWRMSIFLETGYNWRCKKIV